MIFFKDMNKIDKPFAKKNWEKVHILKIISKRRNRITNTNEIQTIIKNTVTDYTPENGIT
jgi:hypothetical protein